MTRSLRPPSADSQFYGPHAARVPAAYTLILPGGTVLYAGDTDCLKRTRDACEEEARVTGWPGPRKVQRSQRTG